MVAYRDDPCALLHVLYVNFLVSFVFGGFNGGIINRWDHNSRDSDVLQLIPIFIW